MKSLSRFAVLPDERRLLLGVDKDNVFKAGVVYEVYNILDQIVFKPIGEYSLPDKGCPSENSEANTIIYYGNHLVTKEEMKILLKKESEGQ